MFQLTPENDADLDAVEYLYDLAFAPGREALSSYRLREGVAPVAALCLVARDDYDVLAGAIRYWSVLAGGVPALLLGPVAVHPTYQGEGLGGLLVRESLLRARDLGWARVLLVGDAPYYGKFGFKKAEGLTFPPPVNPERVLGLGLVNRAWDGIVGEVESASGKAKCAVEM